MTKAFVLALAVLPAGAFAQGVPPTLPDPPPPITGGVLSAADVAQRKVWADAVNQMQASRQAVVAAQAQSDTDMAEMAARFRKIQVQSAETPPPTQPPAEQPEVQQ